MSLWLRIDGAPVRQIITDATALPHTDPKAATHALLLGADVLRSTGIGDENANLSVALANDAGQASRLFALQPPIGRSATLMHGAAEIFEGVIRSVSLTDGVCSMRLEA